MQVPLWAVGCERRGLLLRDAGGGRHPQQVQRGERNRQIQGLRVRAHALKGTTEALRPLTSPTPSPQGWRGARRADGRKRQSRATSKRWTGIRNPSGVLNTSYSKG